MGDETPSIARIDGKRMEFADFRAYPALDEIPPFCGNFLPVREFRPHD
jgi:hypothetical protein